MIQKTYSKKAKKCRVTFRLPEDVATETVSVLGEFNDWDPKANPLKLRKNGTYSTTVSVKAGDSYRFRYLADGDQWLNDEEADDQAVNRFGSLDSILAV